MVGTELKVNFGKKFLEKCFDPEFLFLKIGFFDRLAIFLQFLRSQKSFRYSNHSCNNLGKFGSVDHGTIGSLFYNPKAPTKCCLPLRSSVYKMVSRKSENLFFRKLLMAKLFTSFLYPIAALSDFLPSAGPFY